ncbi:hypothetical protein FKP32DRAFT_1595098 [Trametes sanguinea]|nr:hypothetical protein FKP32DRAFT_1595098 [Trametes sanguinea]
MCVGPRDPSYLYEGNRHSTSTRSVQFNFLSCPSAHADPPLPALPYHSNWPLLASRALPGEPSYQSPIPRLSRTLHRGRPPSVPRQAQLTRVRSGGTQRPAHLPDLAAVAQGVNIPTRMDPGNRVNLSARQRRRPDGVLGVWFGCFALRGRRAPRGWREVARCATGAGTLLWVRDHPKFVPDVPFR